MLCDLSGKHGAPVNLGDLEQYFAEPSPEEIGNQVSTQISVLEKASGTSSQDVEFPSRHLAERFAAAKRNARSRQLRLRVPTVLGGTITFFGGFMLLMTNDELGIWYVPGILLLCISIYFGFLALLPSDKRAVPHFSMFVVTPGLCLVAASNIFRIWQHLKRLRESSCMYRDEIAPCWFVYCLIAQRGILTIANSVGIGTNLLALKKRLSSRALLSICWFSSQSAQHSPSLDPSCLSTSTFTAEFSLGAQNIDDLLIAARSSFKFVRADRVTHKDMEDNRPNPKLAELTEKGRIGFVDAFVSHSWHDDPRNKWIALQKLRDEFKGRTSREPKLWIDEYSIDQNNIDLSLASLPVYLAGCSQLWILCGRTYLERLWCIVEIYVFLEMGGLTSNLCVELLEDGEQMFDLGSQLDPRKARCFTEADTEKL